MFSIPRRTAIAISGLLISCIPGQAAPPPSLEPPSTSSPLSKASNATDSDPQFTSSADSLIRAFEQKVQATVEQSKRSVVAIARVRREKESRQQAFQFQLGRANPMAFERTPDSADFVPQGFGTGVVWDEEGTIVTAYHVLDDPREHDYYVWSNGRPLQATIVKSQAKVMAGDPYTDLAVLKVPSQDLLPIKRSSDVSVEQGEFVVHLGNPQAIARDGKLSAGWGIIANIQRSIPSREKISLVIEKHWLTTAI